MRSHALYTADKPLSSRLPFSYQRVPAAIRTAVARLMAGMNLEVRQAKLDRFPSWPIDLSADILADLSGASNRFVVDGQCPVLLSHDLDSAEGLHNLLADFLDMEEAVGARSCSYIVPKGWPIDLDQMQQVSERGHELGIHGYDHSNLSPFLPAHRIEARLSAARPLIERFQMRGYRAPSLLRTPELLKAVARHYRYDSSIPTAGGLFPVAGNGCATARPFRLHGLVEIPITMPRDGSMLFMGLSPRQIHDLWCNSAMRIARSGGVVALLTHCEKRFSGSAAMLETYRAFLQFLHRSPHFVFTDTQKILQMMPS